MKRYLVLLLSVVITITCFSQSKTRPYVILVSFDGFRPDYVTRFDLPNFKNFIADGASAESLIPSFPSKTFPNHYTIVTGKYPGNHGLVDNQFYDPAIETHYSMRNTDVVRDRSFYGGTPLWQLARKHGVKSASYFWVGSELKEESLRPDYYYHYNQQVPFSDRIERVLEWLTLSEEDRPHFITLYFSSPDYESHRYGPFGELTRQSALAADSLLGKLMAGVRESNLPVNVILVSDHGMSQMVQDESTYIFIDEIIAPENKQVIVSNGGTQAHVYTKTTVQRDSLYDVLSTQSQDFTVVKRENFPARWHYNHSRSGDLLILARPGKYIVTGKRANLIERMEKGKSFGVHGYDPDEVKDMHGIFYANGPNIKKGARIPSFRNVHIYALISEILGMKYTDIDGDFRVLQPIMVK